MSRAEFTSRAAPVAGHAARVACRRAVLALVTVLACLYASGALAAASDGDWERLRARHGAGWTRTACPLTGLPRRLGGGAIPLPSGATDAHDERLLADVERIVREWAPLLGIAASSLGVAEPGPVGATGGLTAVRFVQVHEGVPVEGSSLVVAVSRGSVIALHATGFAPIAATAVPRLSAFDAWEAALSAASFASAQVEPATPRLAFLPREGSHRLAWRVTLIRRKEASRHVAWIDALDGSVLSLTDETVSTCTPSASAAPRVVGGVRPHGAADAEVSQALPGVRVGSSFSDTAGIFTPPAASASLHGALIRVECVECFSPESPQAGLGPDGDLDFGAGGFDSLGNGRATPADRASYFHASRTRDQAARWLGIPWLTAPLDVRTNIPSACNAFWNGIALNFFRGSSRCSNTGEIRDVIAHEWGHGLDENDGLPPPGLSVDAATGEAAADIVALLRSRDSCIGESFFLDPADWPATDCSGVRELDEHAPGNRRGILSTLNVTATCPPSAFYRGPQGTEGHCEGEILGQAFWHLVRTLATGRSHGDGSVLAPGLGEEAAWQVAEAIFYRSRPLLASQAPTRLQSIGMSAHEAFLLADDEGDGLANGTPHAWAIHDAMGHHGLEEQPLPAPLGIACSVTAPAVTVSAVAEGLSNVPVMRVTWTDAGATAMRVLRDDADGGGPHPVSGALAPGAGAFDDWGVLPGRQPRYVVVAEHAGGCLAMGAAVAPAAPALRISGARFDDSITGDGDSRLEPGETADLFLDVSNDGGADLSAVSVSADQVDPELTVISGGPQALGTLASGATMTLPLPFRVRASGNPPDEVALGITLDAAEGCLRATARLPVARPDLHLESRLIDDASGDGDGAFDPGERVGLVLRLRNAGAEDARSVDGVLGFRVPPPAGVTMPRASASWPDIAPAGAADSGAPGFTLDATALVPRGTLVRLSLAVSINGSPHRDFDVDILVGGVAEGQIDWSVAMGTIPGLGTGEIVNQPIIVQASDDDGDGRITGCDVPDIVVDTWNVGGTDQIVVLSGDDGRVLHQFPVTPCRSGWSIFQSLAAADIDGDGIPEIVTDDDGRPCAFELDGTLIWKATSRPWWPDFTPGRCAASPQIWDLDGDGSAEVIVGRAILEGATGAVRYADTTRRDTGHSLVGDIDLDGRIEIISRDGEVRRGDGSLVGQLFPGFWQYGGLVNLDADPEAEVVYVAWLGQPAPTVIARDHDGTFRWEWIPDPAHDMRGPPCFGDFDGDGRAEMAMPAGPEMVGIDDDGREMWRTPVDDASGASGCTVFDFDADGRPEIIFRGETLLRVMHGETGMNLWTAPCRSVTHHEAPIVADVDADGRAEIVIHETAGGNTSTLRAYGNPSWPVARGIWNQEAYAVSHVLADGVANPAPLPRWLSGNDYRGQAIECGCSGATVSVDVDLPCGTPLACLSANIAGGAMPFSLSWDFGDGSPISTETAPCHVYPPGLHAGSLVLVDDAACRVVTPFIVDVPEPLTIVVTDAPGCPGETCLTAVVSGGANPVEVSWAFEGGSAPVAGLTACHDFTGPRWSWTVTARDAGGCLVEATGAGFFPAPPADVGPALRARDHGDPNAADIEATYDWSLDFGAPRPMGEGFVMYRGTSPTVLAPITPPGYLPVTWLDLTPRTPGPLGLHFYVVLAQDACGTLSAE